MLVALAAEAIFWAALFIETLAVISILQSAYGFELSEVIGPVMRSYHAHTAPLTAFGSSLFAAKPPVWFADAAIIAAVLFFTFFIAQARKATAPYDEADLPSAYGEEALSRVDGAIDLLLPAVACAFGAVVLAPTLLPFATLPIALWLLLWRLAGRPCWFQVSPSYYWNIFLLAVIASLSLYFL